MVVCGVKCSFYFLPKQKFVEVTARDEAEKYDICEKFKRVVMKYIKSHKIYRIKHFLIHLTIF